MGRQPVYKMQFKKNGLLENIPESQCEKVGCGVVTKQGVAEEHSKTYYWHRSV